jgi:CheY-like chemotaxis protein
MTESNKTVLIIDDDPKMANELSETFERYNAGELRLPTDLEVPQEVIFKPDYCQDPTILFKKVLDIPQQDILVIDRMFGRSPSQNNDKGASVLRPLRDLRVNSIRIIWTAYPDESNLIECMRLGAWDYIPKDKKGKEDRDKKSKEEEPVGAMKRVVLSALRGLQEQERQKQKQAIDQQGCAFVVDHYGKIYPSCKGHFVAFERHDKEWVLEPVAKSHSLYDLYERLSEQDKDVNSLHITLIRE